MSNQQETEEAVLKDLDCSDLKNMNANQLRALLKKLGNTEDTSSYDKQDLLDYIVDQYKTDCFSELHSERNNDSFHPNETIEEFLEHEDND